MKNLSHCGHEAYIHDRDRFMAALFIPASAREGLFALCALNLELAQIHASVSEEMIGQIRYAWWQEAIEGLYAGAEKPGHPVLEALFVNLKNFPQNELIRLVEAYRAHYPELPEVNEVMEQIAASYIGNASPQHEKHWHKASRIIARHRKRFGKKYNGWLSLRLLAGV